jgi:SH3-like domain-containing protein
LRRRPNAKSAPVARLEATVVGKLRECPDGSSWCKIEVDGFSGWLRKVEFWGVYPTEVTR